MEKNKIKFMTKSAMVAAVYVALTFMFAGLGYREVQFRIAEILVLLVFIDSRYALGLVIGCIIANIPSPLGIVDVIVGPIATMIGLLFIIGVRKVLGENKKALIISSFGPVLSNAVIVGLELTYVFNIPFWMNALSVGFGEFVVVTIAGTVIMSTVMKSETLVEKLCLN